MKMRHLLIGVPLAALPLFVLPFTAFASVPDTVEHYGGSAQAGGARIFVFNNDNADLIVDSKFPLAFADQAGGSGLGYSSAESSYYDYGPAGATLLDAVQPGATNCSPDPTTGAPPPSCVPPAHAQYPGTPDSSIYPGQATPGAPGTPPSSGPSATAHATELGSKSSATYVGTLGSTGSGMEGASSYATTVLSADGKITTTAHSFINEAVIGPFTFNKIDVTAVVSSANGTGTIDQASVKIGSVLANGNEVSLTDQGLTVGPVNTGPISTSGSSIAGLTSFTAELVSPEQTLNGAEAKLTVMGVKVTASGTDPSGTGVQQEFDLGFAAVDTSLTPSSGLSGLGGLSLGIPGGPSSLPGTGPLSAGNFPSAIQQPSVAKSAPAPRLFVPVASRKPLAMAFLGWEALVMCGVAAWVWARKTVMVS